MVQIAKPTEWDSKAALLAHVAGGVPTVFVGTNAEAPRKFYSFQVQSHVELWETAIISSGLGTMPKLALLDNDRKIVVGHDTWVTWIDTKDKNILSSQRIEGVFYEFIRVKKDDEIIVLHELGALRVDSNGRKIWTIDTDIVEEFLCDSDGHLVLMVMDCPEYLEICLETGSVSKKSKVL